MTSPPFPTVRVSVTVTPEVYETYKRLAKASSMSLSKAMGEWLGDTLEAAEFMATKMEQARAAPAIVMREMHAYALGLADETGDMIDRIRKKGAADRAEPRRRSRATLDEATRGPRSPSPPSGNTGGKGTRTGTGKPGGPVQRQASK